MDISLRILTTDLSKEIEERIGKVDLIYSTIVYSLHIKIHLDDCFSAVVNNLFSDKVYCI